MEYYSDNAFESVLMRWMKLEYIIQSEVSQKEKHQYCILMHINEIQKDGNDDLICKAKNKKETQCKEQTFGLVGSEGGMI